jgi:hypothetical protein
MAYGVVPVSVLLAPDVVTIWRPSGATDSHGWAVAAPMTEVSAESANIQIDATPQVRVGLDGSDSGPFGPDALPTATAYLNPDTVVLSGDVLDAPGKGAWVVGSVLPVTDPVAGETSCMVAQLRRWTL